MLRVCSPCLLRYRPRPATYRSPSRPLVPPACPQAAPLRPQPSPVLAWRPEGSQSALGPAYDAQTDRQTVPAGHLRVRTPARQPPPLWPPRSRAPSPPCRPLRTFRASLGRHRGSARCPRPGLGCATTPEPPGTRHFNRRRRERLGPQPCELPQAACREGRSGGYPEWEGTRAVRPLPWPRSLRQSHGARPPACDPWTPTPYPGPLLTCHWCAGSRCLGCRSGSGSSRAARGRPLQAAPRPTPSPPRPGARGNRGPECARWEGLGGPV